MMHPCVCKNMEYAYRLALYNVCISSSAATCMYCVRKAAGLLYQPVQSVTGKTLLSLLLELVYSVLICTAEHQSVLPPTM